MTMKLIGILASYTAGQQAVDQSNWTEWTDWSSCVNGVYNRLRRCHSHQEKRLTEDGLSNFDLVLISRNLLNLILNHLRLQTRVETLLSFY